MTILFFDPNLFLGCHMVCVSHTVALLGLRPLWWQPLRLVGQPPNHRVEEEWDDGIIMDSFLETQPASSSKLAKETKMKKNKN